jgi:AcrR family transcriptional regulator
MAATPQDGRSQRAEAMRQVRRVEILRAAAICFGRQGFHATAISDVIEQAFISRGTFYLYFDSKEALFLDLMDLFIQRIRAAVQVVDPKSPEPAGQILDNVRRVVDVVFDDAELATVVLRENMGLNPEIDDRLRGLYGFLHEMVEGALIKGAAAGLVRDVNTPVVATALIGALREVFYRQLVTPSGHEPDRAAITKSLYEFVRGLVVVG